MLTVRYFAAARAAAGTAEETAPVGDLDALLTLLAQRHGEPLARVLARCSFLIDGVAAHDRSVALPAGTTVDILPPFAGG